MKDDLSLLKDDQNYYGKVGKKYLSNSQIGTLLPNPLAFGQERPDNPAFMGGRLFHYLLIEPDKASTIPVVNASTRNTKAYKEFLAENNLPVALLSAEAESFKALAKRVKGNVHFFEQIYALINEYEVPFIGELEGLDWKCKVDIVGADLIYDLKTTSDLRGFKHKASRYNYDSQAYIYHTLSGGKRMRFLVIDKTTGELGQFDASDAFMEAGKDKVRRASEVYKRYFGEGSTESIQNHFLNVQL